ncbi:MAG: hypothetical protein V5A44_05180, partial [Haloarculaceae archaeon]
MSALPPSRGPGRTRPLGVVSVPAVDDALVALLAAGVGVVGLWAGQRRVIRTVVPIFGDAADVWAS